MPSMFRKKRGGEELSNVLDAQQIMTGPQDNIANMMNNLPKPGGYTLPRESNVSMTIKPIRLFEVIDT